jgi:O-antigen/teichoic acid export membrane protein
VTTGRPPKSSTWQAHEPAVVTLARNVSTRYVLVVVNVLIGLVMLRYNVQHLGPATYGLWMLAASMTPYLTALDFGYGSAVVRYVAEFRVRRDVRALNEVLSTMAYVLSAVGALCYLAAIVAAVLFPYLFNVEPGQVQIGRFVLLMTSLQVALFFPFSIYGGVINGFERYYINNLVGLTFNVVTAIVNVIVLRLGYGLVELVACTTVLRILPLWIYRRNAYRVFPELQVKRHYFRRDRLRELSGFSVYVAVVDWAGRLTYATDTFFLGVLMNTAAVAVFSVAQRISETLLTLTLQIHTFMMPAVVNRALGGELERQRALLVRATRFQLAIAMCLCGGVAALAGVVIRTWLGAGWDDSVRVTQVLALVVVLRALMAMPITVLQGTGDQKFVAAAAAWSALVNLALSIPFVWLGGVTGIAIATAVAALVGVILIFPRSCRAVGLGTWQGGVRIIVPTVWPAAIAMGLILWIQRALGAGMTPVLAALLVGGVVYTGLFLAFGLDRDERQWVLSACRRIAGTRSRQLATSDVIG